MPREYKIKDIPTRSPRLYEAIQLLSLGHTYKQTSQEMFVAHRTVVNQIEKARKDYGVRTNIELIARCYQEGIL